ncbi:MAG: MFS transporter [Clostridia bacterium]|nr:MFS transporter [Clostridia bacterium]
MSKLHQEEKDNILLFVAAWLVYMLTSVTKSNYTASVAYIVSRGLFTKAESGAVAAAFYIFYGIGQMFGGRMVDRYSPYGLMTLGVASALVTNLVLCFTTYYPVVIVVWSLSGIMQFGLWPGVCRIMATDVFPEFRQKANLYLQYAIPVSQLVSYLAAMFILENFGWSAMFGLSTGLMVALLVLWLCVQKRRPTEATDIGRISKKAPEAKSPKGFLPLLLSSGMLLLAITAFGTTVLTIGASVWIPTMLMESYSVSSAWASLQSVFLILVQMVGLAGIYHFAKRVKNPALAMMALFIVSLVPLFVLRFIGTIPLFVAVAMLAFMMMLIKISNYFDVQVTLYFARYGYSGTFAGLKNALSSLGVVAASGGFGILAEKFGWGAITLSWLIIGFVLIMCCIQPILQWKKYFGAAEVNK